MTRFFVAAVGLAIEWKPRSAVLSARSWSDSAALAAKHGQPYTNTFLTAKRQRAQSLTAEVLCLFRNQGQIDIRGALGCATDFKIGGGG